MKKTMNKKFFSNCTQRLGLQLIEVFLNALETRMNKVCLMITSMLFLLYTSLPVSAEITISFATPSEAKVILGARDAFVERMSMFDRMARLETEQPVSEQAYLDSVQEAPLVWAENERALVEREFAVIEPAMTELLPGVDINVLMVKTSGMEEVGADAYTRNNAVILTPDVINSNAIGHNLAHEIFHVVSRYNPDLRNQLYAAIGFEFCGEINHPNELADRRITNPDSPINEHCIAIQVNGENRWALPILFANEPKYEANSGKTFFDYVDFQFLLVERIGARTVIMTDVDGKALVVPAENISGFNEKVGKNTNYTLHPEEIIADNFSLLVRGVVDVESPGLLEKLRIILSSYQVGQ